MMDALIVFLVEKRAIFPVSIPPVLISLEPITQVLLMLILTVGQVLY